MNINDLPTPALLADADALEYNLKTMAAALPGPRLRPHVKAHKCTALAKMQAGAGHKNFTCATIREIEGMAAAGLGDDLLLANEVLDARRLGAVKARVTVAVDSVPTVLAAAKAGIKEVLIDVNVGLPRCGCAPHDAGRLADMARSRGLEVRGVMGYEGHAVGLDDRATREKLTAQSMELLTHAHSATGGDIISAGGTGTFDINVWANEIQAGSYVLMDTAYAKLNLPFRQGLTVLATVISATSSHARRRLRVEGPWNGSRQPVDRRRSSSLVCLRRAHHVRAGFTGEAGRQDSRHAGAHRSDIRLSREGSPGARRAGPGNVADRSEGLVAAGNLRGFSVCVPPRSLARAVGYSSAFDRAPPRTLRATPRTTRELP